MISMGTFLHIQKVLKNNGKPEDYKKDKKLFSFIGIMKCGECGCSITAETQKGKVYYRCTKKKGACYQKYTREDLLENRLWR